MFKNVSFFFFALNTVQYIYWQFHGDYPRASYHVGLSIVWLILDLHGRF